MPKKTDAADDAKAGRLDPYAELETADYEGPPPPSDDDAPHASGPRAGDGGGDVWGRPPRPPPGARRDADRSPAEQAARRAERFAAGKLGNLTGDALARMRRRRDGEDKPVPLPWSRTSDELHGGLWPGCWILVGGTGVGKSQWAFEVAYNAAVRRAVPVAYVGLELDETGLVARLAALGMMGGEVARPASLTHPGQRERVKWSEMYLGRGDPDPLRLFDSPPGTDVLARLNAAPFYLSTGEARGGASGWSYREIMRIAEDLRAAHPDGPALLVVDFLQLVGADPDAGHREDLRERIANAAYAGRMAARKHGISVLLLSATARGYYSLFAGKGAKGENIEPLGNGDPGRFLGTGKESGETEYAADGVLALCRGPWPKGAAPPDVWLAVAKSRTGRGPRAGWCCYGFDGTAFTEKEAPEAPPPEAPEAPPAGSTGNGGSKRGSGEARARHPAEE